MRDEAQLPTTGDRDAWRGYWRAQGMPWRTEAEIDAERQRYLDSRRAVQPDIMQGIYAFRDKDGSIKLTRADVEWLLATHESGGVRGPVDWNDPTQHTREGIDLRGADLRGADLGYLPLARLHAGLSLTEQPNTNPARRRIASIHLDGAELNGTQLQRAELGWAHLNDADLYRANCEGAQCPWADFSGANLSEARFGGARLASAFFDSSAALRGIRLVDAEQRGVALVGVRWGGVDLTHVDWSQVSILGEEREARARRTMEGKAKASDTRLADYRRAVRANGQLATALREQGVNDDADRFAYRAQLLQRQVLLRQGHWGRAIGSGLLDVIAGYGYKPMRSLIAYVLVICLFAGAYLVNAQFAAPHLRWDEALVLSISSFHGRGFFTSGVSLGDTLARLAAGEAIIGLLIEITFIATFTQRFFAR
jgi:uncharacterized protein YjbI with pentapeptide repeats